MVLTGGSCSSSDQLIGRGCMVSMYFYLHADKAVKRQCHAGFIAVMQILVCAMNGLEV